VYHPITLVKQELCALWKFRDFIASAVSQNFRARYRQSILGMAWSIIQPVCLVIIYTVIFSKLMQTRLPSTTNPTSEFTFSIYLCAGLLPWTFFAELMTRLTTVFNDHAQWLKKLRFPHAALIVIAIFNCSIHFFIIFFLFSIFLIGTHHFPGLVFFNVILVLGLQVFFTVGFGLILAVLNVFFRDVGQALALLLQFWFWLTPIVYPITVLPDYAQRIIELNPLTPLIIAYQQILLYGQPPHWQNLLPLIGIAVLGMAIALFLLRKKMADILDEL